MKLRLGLILAAIALGAPAHADVVGLGGVECQKYLGAVLEDREAEYQCMQYILGAISGMEVSSVFEHGVDHQLPNLPEARAYMHSICAQNPSLHLICAAKDLFDSRLKSKPLNR
jgi:hypothetical protein